MGKVARSGHAAVLTKSQREEIFKRLTSPHDAIAQICYWTAGRVDEVCHLRRSDILDKEIVLRACNTKTKASRTVPLARPLIPVLERSDLPSEGFLFPAKRKTKDRWVIRRYKDKVTKEQKKERVFRPAREYLDTRCFDRHLRSVCDFLEIPGVSTHSFRRTMLTELYHKSWTLKEIQLFSGHKSLDALIRYLDVDQAEVHDKFRAMFVQRLNSKIT